jgi:putative transposase
MISGDLDTMLARPRYGRSQVAGDEESAVVTGHRHGSRTRSLTGTFGPIEIAGPRARLNTADGRTTEWKSKALRAYQRAHARRRGAEREHLSGYHHTRQVRRALAALFGGAVARTPWAGCGRKPTGMAHGLTDSRLPYSLFLSRFPCSSEIIPCSFV